MINAGADLKLKNNEEKTALDIANEKDHFEARMVLSNRLDKMGAYWNINLNRTFAMDNKTLGDNSDHIFSI